MRIASVEVVPYALPFKEPYVTARGRLDRRELVLLRLRDEDGVVGLGEAVPLSLRGGAGLAQVVGELRALGGGESLQEASFAGDSSGLSPPSRCAVLTALLDLRGRRAETSPPPTAPPLRSHLLPHTEENCDLNEGGVEVGRAVTCNATLVAGEPAAVADDARRWAAEGFSTFKLKLGTGDDVGQVEAVREAVGEEARIRVDANGAWGVREAKRVLAALEPLGIELAEQPVATLEEAREVVAATSIPIAADESVGSRAEAELAVAIGACALAGVKLSKVGGPEEAISIAEVLPVYLSSALDGPVGIAAGAQVAQTLRQTTGGDGPGLAHGLATQRLFASTIASVECELRGDQLHPPPGPGLGVEIDEDALQAHRL